MSTQTNPYFRLRDRSLRKAEKHYRRAVEAHYMGLWLDQVNAMEKKMHEDNEFVHSEWKQLQKQQKKHLKDLEKMLDELNERLDYW